MHLLGFLSVVRSIMTEFNGSDAGPLGVGAGCVQPRDGKQVCRSRPKTWGLCRLDFPATCMVCLFLHLLLVGEGRSRAAAPCLGFEVKERFSDPLFLCYCTHTAHKRVCVRESIETARWIDLV